MIAQQLTPSAPEHVCAGCNQSSRLLQEAIDDFERINGAVYGTLHWVPRAKAFLGGYKL